MGWHSDHACGKGIPQQGANAVQKSTEGRVKSRFLVPEQPTLFTPLWGTKAVDTCKGTKKHHCTSTGLDISHSYGPTLKPQQETHGP